MSVCMQKQARLTNSVSAFYILMKMEKNIHQMLGNFPIKTKTRSKMLDNYLINIQLSSSSIRQNFQWQLHLSKYQAFTPWVA